MHSMPVHAARIALLLSRGGRRTGQPQEMDHCHHHQLPHRIHQNPCQYDWLEGEPFTLSIPVPLR